MKRFPLPRLLVLTFGIAAAAASWAEDGKAIYEKSCVACHAVGVANAPKLGDKAAWAPRTGQGVPALVATVIKGKGAMPPKAGTDLGEGDLKAAIDYMVGASK